MKRFALFFVLAVILPAVVWLATQRGAGPDPDATIPLRDTGHPVLLLVDARSIEESRPRDERDRWYDLEWANLLVQGYGGCDIADLHEAGSRLDRRQLVVMPRRSAARADEALLRALHERVGDGLAVLVEAPDSSLCRTFGLELATVERRPRLPWPEPVASGTRRQLSLRPRPVDVSWTRFRYAPGAASPMERPRVHLSLDGRPMGWTRAHGSGAWIVLAMDFAELSSRLRQGEAGAPLLAGQDHPWLDAWSEGVFGAALTALPLPRIATAPPAADGWLVIEPPEKAGPAPVAADHPGFSLGTGLPSRPLGRTGRLHAWDLPLIYDGPAAGLEPSRLDRWARHNAAGGAGPLSLSIHDAFGEDLARELSTLPQRRAHTEASRPGLLAWWMARQDVRVRVEQTGDTVDYVVEAVPDAAPGFALLVPVRWRDRSLEGWDAGWGTAPGRRVQRFDRAYRLIDLPPEAEGRRLQLRYR